MPTLRPMRIERHGRGGPLIRNIDAPDTAAVHRCPPHAGGERAHRHPPPAQSGHRARRRRQAVSLPAPPGRTTRAAAGRARRDPDRARERWIRALAAPTFDGSKCRASSTSRRAPKPVGPLGIHRVVVSACAVPAMSMCAQGVVPTNSSRKSAAVIDPAFGPAEVRHVGDSGVELVAVTPDQRQWPGRLVGLLPRRLDLSDDALVVAHHSGDFGAERAQARPGEGRDVDDGVGAVLDRQGERVGHHQAAFGVGVHHLDGLAVTHGEHVAELHGRARRHVVGAHQVAGDRRPAVAALAARSWRRGPRPRRTCRSSSGSARRRWA